MLDPRLSMGKRPVHSIKSIVDSSGGLVGATSSVNDIAVAVNTLPGVTVPNNVMVGSTINAIYLSVYILGDTGGAGGTVNWILFKNPANLMAGGDLPIPGNTGVASNRRFIFHEEKGLFPSLDGTPMIFKGWIKIPPRFRRMGDDDKWQVILRTQGTDTANFCVQAIYKSYS